MAGEFSFANRGLLANSHSYKSGMAGEFSASIDGIAMAYGLASQNSVVNMLMLRTAHGLYGFDFISHPEEFNGENNLGC